MPATGHLAAQAGSGEGPTGGMTKKDTDKHFAQRFDGAAARIQLALLDPNGNLGPLPDRLLEAVAGNPLCITDTPCGAGAATLGLLTTLAELRRNQILPRLPLDVHLIGAELSDHARAYAVELLSEVRQDLEEQAIFADAEWLPWNVKDTVSTADLIRRMTLVSTSHPNQLILVANFSGFLSSPKNRDKAEGPFQELFHHAGAGRGATVLWIEPLMNEVTAKGAMYDWLNKRLDAASQYIRKKLSGAPPDHHVTTETWCYRAVAPEEKIRVNLAATIFQAGRFQ